MKKSIAIALALLAVFAVAAIADEVMIFKTTYEGMGVVDVDFARNVTYRDPAIAVTDSNGFSYASVILERDDDDLAFRVENPAPGLEYSYTLSGVRMGKDGDFTSVTGSFLVPLNEETAIRKVEYDFEDRELEVEFFSRLDLSGMEVHLTDASGAEYELKVRELKGNGFEAYAPGLSRGESYTIQISGLKDGASASFDFKAWDD